MIPWYCWKPKEDVVNPFAESMVLVPSDDSDQYPNSPDGNKRSEESDESTDTNEAMIVNASDNVNANTDTNDQWQW